MLRTWCSSSKKRRSALCGRNSRACVNVCYLAIPGLPRRNTAVTRTAARAPQGPARSPLHASRPTRSGRQPELCARTCACVRVCLCVCTCLCAHVCMCLSVCAHTCMCVCVHMSVRVHMCLCVRTCLCVCVHVCLWSLCARVCVYVCLCVCVCVHVSVSVRVGGAGHVSSWNSCYSTSAQGTPSRGPAHRTRQHEKDKSAGTRAVSVSCGVFPRLVFTD